MPKYLKADIERGFILAYYELVKGCRVSLDFPGENTRCWKCSRRLKKATGVDLPVRYEGLSKGYLFLIYC
ncbi:hypothetical protein MGLY_21180 [Neomoorella glycerini]|uniref:Uncharacterized protein n=1 Tax=Neomoorella glycerini TaxID=55779 RepID=A0A6I5ZSN0_9FIRM|nr:hypothetical protein MGLY_21180 [Moorella glycerini]